MFFSIIVPVYNVEKYIDECLSSISNQDFKDYEVILVDDGSTDNSGYICDEYAKTHYNVKVIHKKNEGLLLARRTGIKSATGEYFLHCDSDDYLCKNALSEIYEVIQSINPDMVMFGYNVVDDEHNVIENHYDVFEDRKIITDSNKENLYRVLVSTTWLNNMVTKVTRRSCVDIDADYRPYSEVSMGEDLLQVMPLFHNCSLSIYLAEPLYNYRYNIEGISKQLSKELVNQNIVVFCKMRDFLFEERLSCGVKEEFYNRFIKDMHKYMLRFIKFGTNREKYKDYYMSITGCELYADAIEYVGKRLTIRNKIFGELIKPKCYYLSALFVRTVLAKKIS